jgi:hypothetical protein
MQHLFPKNAGARAAEVKFSGALRQIQALHTYSFSSNWHLDPTSYAGRLVAESVAVWHRDDREI